jgi:hypothetical protein
MGLKFLNTKTKKFSAFDIETYVQKHNQIPLVIFPENTKTNRKGVLSIRSNLMDILYKVINDHGKILIRSEIVVKKFKYFGPSNTTEFLGLWKLFWTLCQLYNEIEIYSQDIPNSNFDKGMNFDRIKFNRVEDFLDVNLQSQLVEPNNRNIV